MIDLSPGCKVICINDADDTDFHGSCVTTTPIKNHKYTVQQFFISPQAVDSEPVMCECVILKEIDNPNCMCLRFGMLPLGFFAWRFTVEESSTMQQLRKVVADIPKKKVIENV